MKSRLVAGSEELCADSQATLVEDAARRLKDVESFRTQIELISKRISFA